MIGIKLQGGHELGLIPMQIKLIGIFFFVGLSLSALEVDVEELDTVSITETLNFINFTGTHTVIDSIEEIQSIGESLSEIVANRESIVYAQKYRLTHINPSGSRLRGADLLELLPSSQVDYIDNLRLIISAYLEQRYGYSQEDAQLLGILVTIYNAVHRGNIDLFQVRYVEELNNLLRPEAAGLSLSYLDWPGFTQIVIPIASDAAVGELSSIPADELLDTAVEDILRSGNNSDIEERMNAANLIDRIVDEERSQTEEERESIALRKNELSEREINIQSSLSELGAQLAETNEGDPERNEIEVEIAGLESRQEGTQQQLDELLKEEEALNEREEAITSANRRSSEVRALVAKDIRGRTVSSQSATGFTTRSRLSGNRLLSRVLRINVGEAEVLMTTEQEIVGRNYLIIPNGILALGETNGETRLVIFNDIDLSLRLESSVEVSSYTPIVLGSNNDFYAVIREGIRWYAGRFDGALNLLARSTIQIAEESDLTILEGRLFVQREDARIVGLSLRDLRVSP